MKKEIMYPVYDTGELSVTISKGNQKMGNIPQFNTLPGNSPLKLKNGTPLTNIQGTCGKHCVACFNDCYAARFCYFHHHSVVAKYAANTIIMRRNPEKIYNAIKEYCNKNIVKYFRFHTSGELESVEQLKFYALICKDIPDVTFYLYTKAFDILEQWFAQIKDIPDNFRINLSEWHGNLEFVRASPYRKLFEKCGVFAYDDGNSGAYVEGLYHCPAVNKNGNETGVTCAECRRCMMRGSRTAVYAH